MRLILAAAASLAFVGSVSAESLEIPSGTYTLDQTHASVIWKVNHFGFSNYTAQFARSALNATVELDADDVTNSKLEASIDGTEIVTLHPLPKDFDSELASEQFINAEAFPEISFESTGIEVTGEDTAEISGELTLAGVALPFVLETKLNAAANHPLSGAPAFGISAVGTLDRTDFGVNALAGPVGTNVVVEIQAEFIQQQ